MTVLLWMTKHCELMLVSTGLPITRRLYVSSRLFLAMTQIKSRYAFVICALSFMFV